MCDIDVEQQNVIAILQFPVTKFFWFCFVEMWMVVYITFEYKKIVLLEEQGASMYHTPTDLIIGCVKFPVWTGVQMSDDWGQCTLASGVACHRLWSWGNLAWRGERSINGVWVWLTPSFMLLGVGKGEVGLERCSSLFFTPQWAPRTYSSNSLEFGGCWNVTPSFPSYYNTWVSPMKYGNQEHSPVP